jgi:hypothetical protein
MPTVADWAKHGKGPPIVRAANWLTHLEYDWESPVWPHWLEGLAERYTLVRYDERGCGLSDRSLPAAWLTPLLTEPLMIDALTRVRAQPDAAARWDRRSDVEVRRDSRHPALEVVELPDVDHALQVAGDPVASLDALRQMTEALTGWLQRIR